MAIANANPFVQQRNLRAGSAYVRRSDRGVICVSGADRLTWLDGLVSQQVRALAPGASAETLILTPQGRVQYQLSVVDDGQCTFLILDTSAISELAEWLDAMIFSGDVTVREEPDLSVWGVFAGVANDVLATALAGDPVASASGAHSPDAHSPDATAPDVLASDTTAPVVWHDPWNALVSGGVQYATDQHPGAAWTYREYLVPSAAEPRVEAALNTAGFGPADLAAWDALRIATWRPRLEAEGDEALLPHEVDWMRSAVHMSKGCYRGQETVAKVHNLGAPPRRLVLLHLDGMSDTLPERGNEVLLDGTAVGHITSAARHGEDGPIALALVKRTTEETATLDVVTEETVARATQVVVVPTSAGHAVTVEKLPRLRDR
jgi:folate-binding protein YgfZ